MCNMQEAHVDHKGCTCGAHRKHMWSTWEAHVISPKSTHASHVRFTCGLHMCNFCKGSLNEAVHRNIADQIDGLD